MRRAVDFPQPDGPNKAVNWPAGTSRDILFKAGFSSQLLTILSKMTLLPVIL
jgi:hypothetical protein